MEYGRNVAILGKKQSMMTTIRSQVMKGKVPENTSEARSLVTPASAKELIPTGGETPAISFR